MAREKWLAAGAKPEDLPYIQQFERVADRLGLSEAHRGDLVAWALAQSPTAPRERIVEDFYRLAGERGIPVEAAGVVDTWHSSVSETGLPEEKVMPLTGADWKRVADIEYEMGRPRAESAYWKMDTAGAKMRDEYLDLCERNRAEAAPLVGAAPGAAAGASASSPASPSSRKDELLAMAGAARGSPEWQQYWKRGGDAEYSSILSAELGDAGPAQQQGESNE